jgi:mannan endo-1,4-beta-mannosidase
MHNFKPKHLLPALALLIALVCAPSALGAPKAGIFGAKVASQLTIATQTPSDAQTVSGSITWSVSVEGQAPSRVDFAVDGTKTWSQASSPYVYGGVSGGLDTVTLSNGSHTLTATAYGTRGQKASSTVTVTVENSTMPQPEPAPTPEPAPEPEPAPTPPAATAPLYWGATIGSHLTGSQAPWDMTAVNKFEEDTHKKVSLVQFFQPFANCSSSCTMYSFPTTPLENIRQHGAIPVLSWSSQSIPSSLNEPNFQLSDVISGRYDTYIRSFATSAKAWGHPFFLRFNWEMNGTWFPWSEGVNGNTAGQYVAAWRHVHDIFASAGATNITWVWCPNVDYSNDLQAMTSNYPGDAYVDWTGLDGYNWGTNPAKPGGWKSFGQLYRSTYRHIVETVAPSKPMMIGEVASSEYGGSKSAWTKNMLASIPSEYPKIRAMLWFDKFDGGMDWPIETSSGATTGFSEGIQSSAYRGNVFTDLSAGAIQPPS